MNIMETTQNWFRNKMKKFKKSPYFWYLTFEYKISEWILRQLLGGKNYWTMKTKLYLMIFLFVLIAVGIIIGSAKLVWPAENELHKHIKAVSSDCVDCDYVSHANIELEQTYQNVKELCEKLNEKTQ